MYFVRLKIDGFRAIESADVELGRGLNVLYGPNDVGKSTLAAALRAALLLPPQSSETRNCVPWNRRDCAPRTTLHFVDDQDRRWRVRKNFGDSPSGELEATKDDVSFSPECSGREVEEKLRSLLGWGIPGPGGKGSPRGLPHSFLTQVLLAEQTDVRAILKESLEEDKDGSGKVRLTAALKTLAQDPLFKKVLDGTQAEYDVYFGKGGQAKRAKNSPFIKAAEEIKRRSDELADLTKKREESKSAEVRAQTLREEHGMRLETAAEADADLERALALREKARVYEALTLRVAEARARLRSIDAELAVTEEKHGAMEALRAEADRCVAVLDEASRASDLANGAARDATEALRQASSDDATRERDLQRAQIEGQRAALQAKIADAETRRTRAQAAVDAVEAAAQAEAQETKAVTALATKRRALEEARAALGKVEDHLRLTKGLSAYGRWRDGTAAEQESRAASESAAACRAQADALGAEIAALEASLKALSVPTEAEVRAVVALRRSLDLSEAALGGGLSVVVTPKRSLTLRAAPDGTWREAATISRAVEVEAEGKLELQIDDLVDIRVSAGDAARRTAAETLRQRWLSEGEPVLGRAGVTDVAALEARVKSAGDLTRQIEAGRREIATLQDKAKSREARVTELDPIVRSVPEREEALTGLDRAALEQRYLELGKHWEQPAKAREAEQEKALAVAHTNVATLDREVAGLEEGGKHAGAQRIIAAAAREAALAQVGPEPADLARRVSAEIDAARREGEVLEASLARISAGGTAEVDQARRSLESAQAAVKTADVARARATTAATEARSRVDRAAGEVAMLRERGAALDRAGAAAAVRSSEAEVTAFGPVDGLPTDVDVEKAQAIVTEQRMLLLETTRTLDAAEGALQQVGGATIQDDLEDARRAKDNAVDKERDLEVTAKAWQLLRDKLQQAEEAEGAHLGRALGAPVAERLGELTEGRYGTLTLGPTLRTENVEVRGGGSPEDALSFLSVGTLEQLATLVRIAIAEHLRSAIVLDDHLVQSDRARLDWFRRMLRRTATHTQILVLTCRPADYLEESEIPAAGEPMREIAGGAVRAINLETVIRRWQITPGAAAARA
jgi:AAA domain